MGDTANWEFAAVVAAVVMGLSGLLLFTLISSIYAWRMFSRASRAANEALAASLEVQDLARYLASRTAQQLPIINLREQASELDDLRRQADALIEQQARLQEAVRNLVEAGVLGNGAADQQLRELDAVIRRLEDNLNRIAIAVNALEQRPAPQGR